VLSGMLQCSPHLRPYDPRLSVQPAL